MKLRLYIIIFFIILFNPILAQETKEELEVKREVNQKQIEYTDMLLKQTSQKREETLNNYLIINKRISLRNNIIKTIEDQVKSSEIDIQRLNIEIQVLEVNLSDSKDEYRRLIQFAYKRMSAYNNLMYIFSAEDINQAYKRLKYLQQYISYRKDKIKEITYIKNELVDKSNLFEDEKEKLKRLINEKVWEKEKLIREGEREKGMIKKLSSKEKELKGELEKQKNIAKRIESEIEELVRLASINNKYKQTHEDRVISGGFLKNKGGLPWPTERGIVIEKYGEHNHPILKGIKMKNNGINIGTTKGAKCRSVFEGEVKSVINIPGNNKAVIIRHGDFLTVYTNLIDLQVKKGDKVNTKQVIGTIYTEESKTTLHFEIWEENNKQNPELWLSKN